MAGIGGFATTLTSTTTFATKLLEVTNISLPEVGLTDIDVSSFDSTDNFMEFIGGAKDPGVIDLELNFKPSEDTKLLDALGAINETWTITFPDGSTWATDGYINKMGGGSTTTNDKISRVASIKCSGKPTFTP